MSNHISEELPRLLTGDATREVVLAAAEHLRSCADCQQELVSAVVAHAALTSAHRFAPDIVATTIDEPAAEATEARPLPDLTSMFTQVRQEATAPQPRTAHRRQRLLAVAAAVAVLGGGTAVVASTVDFGGSTQTASRSIPLEPFGTGQRGAKHAARVTLVGNNTMKIDATSLPKLDSHHFYEVWLTDDARTKMWSAGSIGTDNKAELAVPSKVMSQYNDIEVSVQRTNQIKYSGTSVLRGSYG